ncbi:hypothetical protein CN345_06655 [Bacillus thuringiensis]|uniref:hypothetical protein n=1 Tax=Bacillus thuringiensis TaxID=1428 RepID=UPI000BF7A2A7|nr:hypothetical protein [Bacillus thuringiensis]PEZ41918.1 hypothetical protein CN345_06655 [Bacillus thuringiensis]PGY61396.1 hypothetical protein COE09_06920 [Bacillus thuringiensis]
MGVPIVKQKQFLRALKSSGYYIAIIGVVFSALYLLKFVILQILGSLLIIAFLALGFYFLGYVLIGVFSLLIIVGSVICTLSLFVYFLA